MNENSFKKIARGLIPPLIYSNLARMKTYRKKKAQSRWITVKNGLLQGRQLLLSTLKGSWQESMAEGSYDQFIFEYLQKEDIKGAVVFDIGSHIGYHALSFASLVGDEGSVYAFEPNRFNRERMGIIIEKNPDLAKRIRIYEAAVSDRVGTAQFYFSRDVESGASSGSFVSEAHTYYEKNQAYLNSFEISEVKTFTLDGIGPLIGRGIRPDIIKIDVEGAEGSVLEGARNTLALYKPLLLIEVHSIYNMLKVCEILGELNYKISLLKEEPDGRCFLAASCSQTKT